MSRAVGKRRAWLTSGGRSINIKWNEMKCGLLGRSSQRMIKAVISTVIVVVVLGMNEYTRTVVKARKEGRRGSRSCCCCHDAKSARPEWWSAKGVDALRRAAAAQGGRSGWKVS